MESWLFYGFLKEVKKKKNEKIKNDLFSQRFLLAIDHFQVPLSLSFKTGRSAKSFL